MLPGLSGHLCRELLHQLLLRLCHLHLPRLHGQVAEQGDRGRGGSGQKREFKNFKCNTRRFVQGPGLVFEVYPQAVATLPGSQFWSVIFFFMLIMLGMDSAMGGLECVITGLMDEFRDTFRRRGISREMFTGFVVFFSFIMASTCVTPVKYERISRYQYFTVGEYIRAGFTSSASSRTTRPASPCSPPSAWRPWRCPGSTASRTFQMTCSRCSVIGPASTGGSPGSLLVLPS